MEKFEVKTTKIEKKVEIGRKDILNYIHNIEKVYIPERADVFVWVPSGGDWSSTRLDIDDDTPIQITWTETK